MTYVNNIQSKEQTLIDSDILEYSVFGTKTFNQYHYNKQKDKEGSAVLFFINKIAPYFQTPMVYNKKRPYIGWSNYPETGLLSKYKK